MKKVSSNFRGNLPHWVCMSVRVSIPLERDLTPYKLLCPDHSFQFTSSIANSDSQASGRPLNWGLRLVHVAPMCVTASPLAFRGLQHLKARGSNEPDHYTSDIRETELRRYSDVRELVCSMSIHWSIPSFISSPGRQSNSEMWALGSILQMKAIGRRHSIARQLRPRQNPASLTTAELVCCRLIEGEWTQMSEWMPTSFCCLASRIDLIQAPFSLYFLYQRN